jgi:vacuolar-type H+-ATPase subunit H
MDDKRIEQVLEIENQAKELHEAAQREADQLRLKAEQDAQALIDKTRSDAEQEARWIVAHVKVEDERDRILSQAEQDAREMEGVAQVHFSRAVTFVLNQVVGMEKS